jgi:hypothetical protein
MRDMLWVSNGGRYAMEKAHALVNVRDINLICQYYKTYAQIEGVARRRKITRARRRSGILEVRTAARDEWIQPVVWIEWINDLGVPIRYMAQDIR